MSDMFPRRNKKDLPYCEAISRRQFEATSWGGAHLRCGNYGRVEVVENGVTHLACRTHADRNKRYGWNPKVKLEKKKVRNATS